MINISASLIKDYISCPRKAHYRLNYSGQAESTEQMNRGSIVHAILEKYWTNEKLALSKIDSVCQEFNYTENKDFIKKCVSNFFMMFPNGTLGSDDKIEYYFKYTYLTKYAIVGRMDRIHNNVVFDWKTSTSPPDDLSADIQFILYDMAYKKCFGKKATALTYISLANKKRYVYKEDLFKVDEFKNVILPRMLADLKDTNSLPRSGIFDYKVCKFCSYAKLCLQNVGD